MHLYNRLSFLLRYGLTRCFSTFLILILSSFLCCPPRKQIDLAFFRRTVDSRDAYYGFWYLTHTSFSCCWG